MIDPVALATLTASATVLGRDCLNGLATEAGKTAWQGIKTLFGWTSDPTPAAMPEQVATSLLASPEVMEGLLALLQGAKTEDASSMVGTLQVSGGKVVVANTINAVTFTF